MIVSENLVRELLAFVFVKYSTSCISKISLQFIVRGSSGRVWDRIRVAQERAITGSRDFRISLFSKFIMHGWCLITHGPMACYN